MPLTGEAARGARRPIQAFERGAPGGFWMRTVAFMIDTVFVVAVVFVIYLLFGEGTGEYSREEYSAIIYASLVSLAFLFLYSPVLIRLWSTTVGKRAFRLYVLRSDGRRCGLRRAIGRQCAAVLSVSLLGIGYLMIAFRADKRGLHDFMADTAVVRR